MQQYPPHGGWQPQPNYPPNWSPQPPQKRSNVALIIVLVVVAVVIFPIAGCVVCTSCAFIGASAKSGDAGTPAPTATSDLPSRGEQGFLYASSGDGSLPIYPDEETVEKCAKAAGANDRRTLAACDLVAVAVPSGTRIRAIGGSLFYKEIEVLEGAARGRSGWVPKEWTHRAPKRR